MEEKKKCIKCKKEKLLTEFSKNQNMCKVCRKEYYDEHKDEIREKSKSVGIRFTTDELEIIDERATKVNLKRSEYIKECIWEKSAQPILKIDFSSLDNLVYEINKIGVNINQIAHIANSELHIYKSDIKYLKESMERIENKLGDYYDIVLKLQKKYY